MATALTTLYRPVGPKELELIKASGYTKFPPRLPDQPIFNPVMNEAYAAQISNEWHVRAYGAGYVTMFYVDSNFLTRYQVRNVGGAIHNELWVPAEELEDFNRHIAGGIRVIAKFEANLSSSVTH